MDQPGPSAGHPARPAAPAPARTAVKLSYASAALSAAGLMIGPALIIAGVEAAARGRFLGHSLTAPQMRPLIFTVRIVIGPAGIALWLWMAQANGQDRNPARVLSTVLADLATLQLRGAFGQPVSHAGFSVTVPCSAAPCCSPQPGWPALRRCDCCGVPPPPRCASRRASWPGRALSELSVPRGPVSSYRRCHFRCHLGRPAGRG